MVFTHEAALAGHLLYPNRSASLKMMLDRVLITQNARLLLRLYDPSYKRECGESKGKWEVLDTH